MALPDISQVPRKTWIIALGIGGGATAIMVWKNRQNDDSANTQIATAVDATDPMAQENVRTGLSPIISPVIIPGTGDPDAGGGALSALYIDAVSGFLSAQEAALGPLQQTQQQLLLDQSAALAAIAAAGGSPRGQEPIASVPAPAVPAATAIPANPTPAPSAPAWKAEYRNVTRDNGKTGTARRVWCVRQYIHRYPDGRGVVVSEDKIRDGKC